MLINPKNHQILSEQSGTVAGDDIELDQYCLWGYTQDQFGADEAVQNQGSSNTNGQGAVC